MCHVSGARTRARRLTRVNHSRTHPRAGRVICIRVSMAMRLPVNKELRIISGNRSAAEILPEIIM